MRFDLDFFVVLQKVVPQKLITFLAGCLADIRLPALKNLLIELFVRAYQVDMSEAKALSISQYPTFNDFFTRELKAGARPVDTEARSVVSPADGAISEAGKIRNGTLLQAKGVEYSVASLLADRELAEQLEGGSFATVYLSPRDYHRVHMPFRGEAEKMIYVPGKLFSVNQRTAENLDSLFARNERLVATFTHEGHRFALVMVGAMIVGGMETVLTGKLPRGKQLRHLDIEKQILEKGQEFGRFYLGSTAIMLFPKDMNLEYSEEVIAGQKVRMGERLADANL